MPNQKPLPEQLGVLLRRCSTTDLDDPSSGSHSVVSSLPPLLPQKVFDSSLQKVITSLSSTYPTSAVAILHLLNDDLSSAHALVQDDEGDSDSNLIHSILHRRESDFWNSKWWLSQIGTHAYLTQIYTNSSSSKSGPRDATNKAKTFVDRVEKLTKNGSSTPCAAKNDLRDAKTWQAKELLGLAEFIFKKHDVTLST